MPVGWIPEKITRGDPDVVETFRVDGGFDLHADRWNHRMLDIGGKLET